MEFLKSITQTLGLTRKRSSNRKSKTRKIYPAPKSTSPKKSKIFEYVRRSARHSGENQQPNEKKALEIIGNNNFDINKTSNGEKLFFVAYRSKNIKVFKAMLNHSTTKINNTTTKAIIVDIVQKANADNNTQILSALKTKGILKRGYLPSELRKLVNDKV